MKNVKHVFLSMNFLTEQIMDVSLKDISAMESIFQWLEDEEAG